RPNGVGVTDLRRREQTGYVILLVTSTCLRQLHVIAVVRRTVALHVKGRTLTCLSPVRFLLLPPRGFPGGNRPSQIVDTVANHPAAAPGYHGRPGPDRIHISAIVVNRTLVLGCPISSRPIAQNRYIIPPISVFRQKIMHAVRAEGPTGG